MYLQQPPFARLGVFIKVRACLKNILPTPIKIYIKYNIPLIVRSLGRGYRVGAKRCTFVHFAFGPHRRFLHYGAITTVKVSWFFFAHYTSRSSKIISRSPLYSTLCVFDRNFSKNRRSSSGYMFCFCFFPLLCNQQLYFYSFGMQPGLLL